jgi:uncharacterized transporter YbjL
MTQQFPPVTINFASVNIVGVPGLMLVLVAVAIAFEFPETRWLLLLGLAGGAIVATLMIAVRSHRGPVPPRVSFPALRRR